MGILLPDERIEEQKGQKTYIVDCRVASVSEDESFGHWGTHFGNMSTDPNAIPMWA